MRYPSCTQTIISGMGELHLEIYVERMRREYKVQCTISKPCLMYREVISQGADLTYIHAQEAD